MPCLSGPFSDPHVQVVQQAADFLLDLVADGAHLLDVQAVGVG